MGVVSIEDITVYYHMVLFQLDSEVCTTILASMWACTRTSACIASLRTISVVVRVCGTHG